MSKTIKIIEGHPSTFCESDKHQMSWWRSGGTDVYGCSKCSYSFVPLLNLGVDQHYCAIDNPGDPYDGEHHWIPDFSLIAQMVSNTAVTQTPENSAKNTKTPEGADQEN